MEILKYWASLKAFAVKDIWLIKYRCTVITLKLNFLLQKGQFIKKKVEVLNDEKK